MHTIFFTFGEAILKAARRFSPRLRLAHFVKMARRVGVQAPKKIASKVERNPEVRKKFGNIGETRHGAVWMLPTINLLQEKVAPSSDEERNRYKEVI